MDGDYRAQGAFRAPDRSLDVAQGDVRRGGSAARWLGALAVVLVVTGVGVGTLTSTEVGRRVFLDQQITMMESFGRRPNDAQVLQMEARIAHGPSIGVAGQAVAVVLVIAFDLAAVKTTLSGV